MIGKYYRKEWKILSLIIYKIIGNENEMSALILNANIRYGLALT